ncbi:MAG: hypothetical protein LCH58_00195 [Bacteroidetes bacterium]|uniref:type II CRISPR RNA-guided endonuclease Cas9 n=1 Tax=Phnomibacter sp. TaxID=2836217 RepID=UPI002FDD4E7A|nr:hypothetical protein [Bacteroidota bacterium]
MEKILGLDLGTNSIGWAIREVNPELENQIIDKGVLTFDKGVAEDKSGEHPMVQKRTESRGKRRNYQAEKYRKWELLECLIHNQMCPLSIEELNEWRYYTKRLGRKYPKNEKFIQWLRFDFDGDGKPDFERLGFSKHESYYLFRALIVDESKVDIFRKEPSIIGRVLYQLVQRRGYNDGQNIDEAEKDELSKTIMKGGGEAGAVGVNEILPYLEKHKTLGAALYYLQKEQKTRIRKRYNLRSHFQNEIKEICRIQKLDHLYKAFWGAIIWQRPLRGQKGLVGVCTFEQNKRRCPISHPFYEEYRTWVFINNLKIKPIVKNGKEINSMPLNDALHQVVYPQFIKAGSDFKLSSIIAKLKEKGFEISAKFPEDTKVLSLSFIYQIGKIFGKEWQEKVGWTDSLEGKSKVVPYDIEDLWHLHFTKKDNKESGESSNDFLHRFGLEKLELDEEKAIAFSKIRLQQGYATLSLNAIKKILPYLQQGFLYSEAVYLANLPKILGITTVDNTTIEHFAEEVKRIHKQNSIDKKTIQVVNELINDQLNSDSRFGMDPAYELDKSDFDDIDAKFQEVFGKYSWQNLEADSKNAALKLVSEKYLSFLRKRIHTKNVFEKTERLHAKIFNWLKETYDVPDENIKHLWHPSEQESYLPAIVENGKAYLRTPEPISKGFKNPMALKTLHKLKRLVNYLIKVGKIDEDTRVAIEIARELNDANKRKAIERWQREREKHNADYKKMIDELNEKTNSTFNSSDKSLIDKIRLWEEQNRLCIYTGKTISLSDLLSGNKYDFEHSIPASMSFDNELKNLTVADSFYNREIKKKRLPSECPNYNDEFVFDGKTYPPILSTLQNIFGRMVENEVDIKGKIIIKQSFEKIEQLEKQYLEWKAKTSDDKQIKDNIIIKRHLIKMELDYWRYKLNTFTTTEYKASWRNSQLRDTQTITKYALPFLKTVFHKVEVQKGTITADFRRIYQIQQPLEKKERTKHSHHAIDAAVLTLIPPAAKRDKILLRYNESKETKQAYHAKPDHWSSFHQQYIQAIEKDILINYLPDHRTLTPTFKKVRKRGQVQYVKEKLPNGKWQFKHDINGKKIPLIAKGDSIRGQLHKESFFGAIKMPIYELKNGKYIPKSDGKGNFLFQENEKRNDSIFFVEREINLSNFTKLEDLEIVIDPNLRVYLQNLIKERISSGKSFKAAISEPFWAFGKKFDKNGNPISPIRHLRVKAKGSGAYINNPAEIRIRKNYESLKPYKNMYYAINGEIPFCALYELDGMNKVERELVSYPILEIAHNFKFNGPTGIVEAYQKKGTKLILPLKAILRPGQKVIFYKESVAELLDLSNNNSYSELSKRMYTINNFDGDRIVFIHHLCSLPQESITTEMENRGFKKGASFLDYDHPFQKLRLSKNALNMAIEDKDFTLLLDGSISWKF